MSSQISTEDLKNDVEELAIIAIEDRVSSERIHAYTHIRDIKYSEDLQSSMEHDILMGDIAGINTISRRFANKLVSIVSKYEFQREKKLILECVELLLDKEAKQNEQ
jgi:hypothetical protein